MEPKRCIFLGLAALFTMKVNECTIKFRISLLILIFLINRTIQFTKLELNCFESFESNLFSGPVDPVHKMSLNYFFTNLTDLVFWVRSFQWVSWSSSHHQSICSFESDHFHHDDSCDPVPKISLNDLFTNWTALILLSQIFSMGPAL